MEAAGASATDPGTQLTQLCTQALHSFCHESLFPNPLAQGLPFENVHKAPLYVRLLGEHSSALWFVLRVPLCHTLAAGFGIWVYIGMPFIIAVNDPSLTSFLKT